MDRFARKTASASQSRRAASLPQTRTDQREYPKLVEREFQFPILIRGTKTQDEPLPVLRLMTM